MSPSIYDIKIKLQRRLIVLTAIFLLALIAIFGLVLTKYLLIDRTLRETRLSTAITSTINSFANEAAIIAGSVEVSDFLRSSADSQATKSVTVTEQLLPFIHGPVRGVKLSGEEAKILISIGEETADFLDFKVCFLGNRLNAKFGRCQGGVRLYLDTAQVIDRMREYDTDISPCSTCQPFTIKPIIDEDKAALLPIGELNLRFEHPNSNAFNIAALGFLIIPICLMFALLSWKFVSKTIDEDLVFPVLSFVNETLQTEKTTKTSKIRLAELIKVNESTKVTAAIARTTKMLAHDVRRPFSMLLGLLDIIEVTQDAQKLQLMARKYVPEVRKSLTSVNDMIDDVLIIGSRNTLNLASLNPETLVENAVNECFRQTAKIDVELYYAFNHSSKVKVDLLKVLRVFSNILTNAVEAMNKNGAIYFETQQVVEKNQAMVKFYVRNTDSFVPPLLQAQLFEPFFTNGKRGGTGLGLAICKEIIECHGGIISVESSQEEGTTFIFSLPVDEINTSDWAHQLPQNSASIRDLFQIGTTSLGITEDPNDMKLESVIINRSRDLDRTFKVLLVDDESVYRTILSEQINRSPRLADCVEIIECSDGAASLVMFGKEKPDLVIMDIDFGKGFETGFEAAAAIYSLDKTAAICLHSNRATDNKEMSSYSDYAIGFMPKPMGRTHFLKIMADVCERASI